jgi:hypothetical protein
MYLPDQGGLFGGIFGGNTMGAPKSLLGGGMDPKTMGLLSAAAALMQAGGASRTPVSTGQAFGQGLQSGLLGYQGGQQEQFQNQMREAQLGAMKRKTEAETRNEQYLSEFEQTLPPSERSKFRVNPAEYIKESNKKYVVGGNLVPGSGGAPLFTAPPEQRLVDVPVPGQPGVMQPTWLRPGETQGSAVGGPKMPEILNPAVQAAKRDVAAAGASRQTQVVNPALNPFKNEKELRDEYRGNPVVKNADEMNAAFSTIETAFKNPSPANDLAMATKYMKILDPTSVVRESELALAMNATGLIDKVRNYAEQIATGKKLNPAQRQDFYSSAKAINDAFQKQKSGIATNYRGIASQYNLKPDNVTFDVGGAPVGDVGNDPLGIRKPK